MASRSITTQWILAPIAAGALAGASAVSAQAPVYPIPGFDVSRAVTNYNALMSGTKQVSDLNGIERREVEEIRRQIRAQSVDRRLSRETCIDEARQNRGGSVSELESRIIDLACSQR